MQCWHCNKPIELVSGKIGFRASCIHCNSDLHVCKNCRYYSVGKPNDCLVPGTEPIRDREASNLCEEFKSRIPQSQALSPSKNILGEVEKKRDFNSLFQDP